MCMLCSALETRTSKYLRLMSTISTDCRKSSSKVAEVALSARYSAIVEQKLPSRFGFAFLQDEELSPTNHSDCYKSNGTKNPKKVRASEIDGKTPVAIDRLQVVMDKGQSQGSQVDQVYHPDVEVKSQ